MEEKGEDDVAKSVRDIRLMLENLDLTDPEGTVKLLHGGLRTAIGLLTQTQEKLMESYKKNKELCDMLLENSRKDIHTTMQQAQMEFHTAMGKMSNQITHMLFIPEVVVPLARKYPDHHIHSTSEKNTCYICIPDDDPVEENRIEIGVEVSVVDVNFDHKFKVSHDVREEDFVFNFPREGRVFDTFDEACVSVDFLLGNLMAAAKPFILALE